MQPKFRKKKSKTQTEQDEEQRAKVADTDEQEDERAKKTKEEPAETTEEKKARQKKEAHDWIRDLPDKTVCVYTDGGYDPPREARTTPSGRHIPAQPERAGWGAEIWYRVIIDDDSRPDVDDRPRTIRNRPRNKTILSLHGPVQFDTSSSYYVAAVEPPSSNVAELVDNRGGMTETR